MRRIKKFKFESDYFDVKSTLNYPSLSKTDDSKKIWILEKESDNNYIGEINENNEIILDETLFESGTYQLRYLDKDGNVLSNFKPITEITI
jgi:hypothetical protein